MKLRFYFTILLLLVSVNSYSQGWMSESSGITTRLSDVIFPNAHEFEASGLSSSIYFSKILTGNF